MFRGGFAPYKVQHGPLNGFRVPSVHPVDLKLRKRDPRGVEVVSLGALGTKTMCLSFDLKWKNVKRCVRGPNFFLKFKM